MKVVASGGIGGKVTIDHVDMLIVESEARPHKNVITEGKDGLLMVEGFLNEEGKAINLKADADTWQKRAIVAEAKLEELRMAFAILAAGTIHEEYE